MGIEIIESGNGVEITVRDFTFRLTDGDAEELRSMLAARETDRGGIADLRVGDIVEFDSEGVHYDPMPCARDEDGDWYVGQEIDRHWFLRYLGGGRYRPWDDVTNIVIHRELRVREPEEPGLYATQSGVLLLFRSPQRHAYPWLRVEGVWADGDSSEVWEAVVGQLGESEFPLRKVTATLE